MDTAKILIIDDDPRNIYALRATLQANGFETVTATGADEGIAILKEQRDISLVLLDMMMPGMDGYQALSQIRNERQEAFPVIAVTAQAMKGDREKCLEAGANDYIAKPIDVDDLLAKLKHHLS